MKREVSEIRHEVGVKVGLTLWTVVKYFVLSLALAFVGYFLFALFFDTRAERELKAANEQLEARYNALEEQITLTDRVLVGLRERDREIYAEIFSAIPPGYILDASDTTGIDLSRVGYMSPDDIVWGAYVGISRMESRAKVVEGMIASINGALDSLGRKPTTIPSILPAADFTITRTGASVGSKFNPFFKTIRQHEGIDLLLPSGTPVLAAADGTVTEVETGNRRFGTRIVISHPGGIRTSYSHLSSVSVSKGQTVRQGQKIALSGSSGRSFAPHLHYEVEAGGQLVEPVHYFFADLDRDSYRDMLMRAMTNGQSLD